MTRSTILVIAVALVLTPLAACAAAGEKLNVQMGSSALVQDAQEFGFPRSHKNIKPRKDGAAILDPNRTSKGRAMTPSEMRDLYTGMQVLLDALRLQKKQPEGLDRAWGSLSASAKAFLRDAGVNDDNWKQLIGLVNILPRRIHGIQAVDASRGGNGGYVYETRWRKVPETYTVQVPVVAPAGCGCRGWYVVGYRDETRTRMVDQAYTAPAARKVPVNETVAILTPKDAVKVTYTQRWVQETYYVSVPVIAPYGCGCRGGYVVGYRDEPRTRMVQVTDTHRENVVAFQTHVANNFKGKGNPNFDRTIQTYLQEGTFKLLGGNMAEIKTYENGADQAPPLDPNGKAAELAGSGKAGELASAGAPITR